MRRLIFSWLPHERHLDVSIYSQQNEPIVRGDPLARFASPVLIVFLLFFFRFFDDVGALFLPLCLALSHSCKLGCTVDTPPPISRAHDRARQKPKHLVGFILVLSQTTFHGNIGSTLDDAHWAVYKLYILLMLWLPCRCCFTQKNNEGVSVYTIGKWEAQIKVPGDVWGC